MGIKRRNEEVVGSFLSVPTRSGLYFMFSVSAFGPSERPPEMCVTVSWLDHLCGPESHILQSVIKLRLHVFSAQAELGLEMIRS